MYRTKIVFDMEDDNKTTATFAVTGPTYGTLAECIRLMCREGTYEIPTTVYSGRRLLRTETVVVKVVGKAATWRVA